MEARNKRFAGTEDRLSGYQVYDRHGEKIGKVDHLFVDDLNDQLEYIGVKTGFSGLRSTLIPTFVVRIDDGRQLIEVFYSKDKVKDAPTFEDLKEITAEFEREVRSYFGLCALEAAVAELADGATDALLKPPMTEPLWQGSRTKRNSWSSHITANRRRTSYRVEETPEAYVGYGVHDPEGRRIGSVRKFFANAYGEPEYIKVRMGLFGLKSFLIPICFVAVDEERRTLTLQ